MRSDILLFLTYATCSGRRFSPIIRRIYNNVKGKIEEAGLNFTFYIFVLLPDFGEKFRPKHVAYVRKMSAGTYSVCDK